MSGPGQVEQELEEEEELTLTALPDLPLLRVLSHLSGEDLLSVGRVCTRLCELTRGHSSLWWGKGGFIESEELLVDQLLLQATPPSADLRLELDVDAYHDKKRRVRGFHFLFSNSSDELDEADVGNRARSLSLLISCIIGHSIPGARVIRKLGSRTRYIDLKSKCIRLGEIFDSLQNATSLETLSVDWEYDGYEVPPLKCFKTLQKLRSVSILLDPFSEDSTFVDLRLFSQLLEAHGDQLRCVRLLTRDAAPLLDACPSGLHRLTVVAEKGVLAKLERMRHLSELVFESHPPPAPSELATLLRTWQGPPLRLTVRQCETELVRVLGAAVTPSVTHLELGGWDWGSIGESGLRALPAVLPALLRLQSLVLFASDLVSDVFRELASGPVLSLLFLNDIQSSVCRDLVLRNSTSLHVVNRSFNKNYRYKVILFGRHPEAGLESCSVCAEVRSIIKQEDCRTLRYVCCEQSD